MISSPWGTKMFQFPQCPSLFKEGCLSITSDGFPHSDIPGSTLAWQLPEAFRSRATSFFGPWHLGIHRKPFVAYAISQLLLKSFLFSC